jgi:acetyltransferase
MSIRNLDSLFDPRSVAVFGASPRPASVGATVWRNLREGGYAGALYAVNPKHREIGGQPSYKNLAALPAVPELAVICAPPASVPGLVARLAKAGTRAAVVMTAGLGAKRQQAMLDAARPGLLRILGPNGIGLLAPHVGLNASFAHIGAAAGTLAFVSQSAALVTAMLDWAQGRGIGFSQVVSLGEHADVDFGDMLDYLATDARTRAILLYVESLQSPRKFMSAARAAARNKPVLVVKAGRSAEGRRAAASHSGASATSDLVFDAAIRRAGMLRVDTLQDLFLAAEMLAQFRGMPPAHEAEARERLTIVGNGGGAGVLAADAAAQAGIVLAPLPEAVRQALDAALPPGWSRTNPVDLIGDAPIERYVHAIGTLLGARSCGTLLFMHAPTAIVPSAEIAQALLPLARATPQRMLSSWLGDAAVADARRRFRQAGIPTYETPEQAVRAFSWLVTYRRNQEQLMEAPPAPRTGSPAPPDGIDLPRVRAIVDAALAAGRQALSEPEAGDLLAACGVPVVATRVVAASADAAAAAASAIGFPVALKILSPQLGSKSEASGVALGLFDADAVRAAATVMQARLAHLRPDATVAGFTVQPMVRRPQALELTVGASIDPLFGPVLLFGHGGSAVDVVADRAVALPPLNLPLARALVARTRVARLLAGWCEVPPADTEALHAVLVALSQLLAGEPRIAELDINPLLADAQGVVALAARVRVDAAGPGGAARFAIRPYPWELVETLAWQGRTLTLRPIRPEDEVQHRAFLERLDPLDIRMRVFYSRRTIERSELARLTQIDYEREMAFVATVPGPQGIEETLGVVRATTDPDNVEAEFGIVVRSDLKGGGLGERLMKKLIQHLRLRGTQRLVATVLRENERMLELARELGFAPDPARAEPDTHTIVLPLQR